MDINCCACVYIQTCTRHMNLIMQYTNTYYIIYFIAVGSYLKFFFVRCMDKLLCMCVYTVLQVIIIMTTSLMQQFIYTPSIPRRLTPIEQ